MSAEATAWRRLTAVLGWCAGLVAVGVCLAPFAGAKPAFMYTMGILAGYFGWGRQPLTRLFRIRRYRRWLELQSRPATGGPYRVEQFHWAGARLTHEEKQATIDRMNRGEAKRARALATGKRGRE